MSFAVDFVWMTFPHAQVMVVSWYVGCVSVFICCTLSFPCEAALGPSLSYIPVLVGPRHPWLRVSDRGRIHRFQERFIILAFPEPVNQQLEDLLVLHGVDDPPQHPHLLQLLLREEKLFLAGARLLDVDGGEEPAVRELPVQDY